jgi:hypothetical protein
MRTLVIYFTELLCMGAIFVLPQIISMNVGIYMQACLECIDPEYVRIYIYMSAYNILILNMQQFMRMPTWNVLLWNTHYYYFVYEI